MLLELTSLTSNGNVPIKGSKIYKRDHGVSNSASPSRKHSHHSIVKIRFSSAVFTAMPLFAISLLFSALAAAVALPQLPAFSGLAIPTFPSFGDGSSGGTPSVPTGLSSLPTGLGSGFGSGSAIPTAVPSLGSGLGSGFGSGPGSASGSISALSTTPTASSLIAANAGSCTDIMLIFARGTSEAQGFGSVGGPLDSALKKKFTSYSSYAVVYPAGFDQNSASGSADAL